jgi:diguanylate cyclase (GGDEF)-like protein/PAS domain S-box-containing protein
MSEKDLNKDRLELALEAAGLDLWENDLLSGEVTRRATKIFAELGYDDQEALSYMDDLFKIVHPEDVDRVKQAIGEHLAGASPQYRCEFRLRAKDGSWVWYANYGKVMDRSSATPGNRFIGVTFNIDDRKRQEEALSLREQEWRTLTENSPDTIARYGSDLRRIYANPALGNLIEGGISALLGTRPSETHIGSDAITYETQLREVFASGEGSQYELLWTDRNGNEKCSQIRLTPEFDTGGKVVSILAVGHDITELNRSRSELREANEQLEDVNLRLRSLADRDPLTHLFNRRALMKYIRQTITFNERNHRNAALLFIDLDNFKTLNDTYGHAVGDLLLQEVARRLTGCIREVDTVSRFGGDEFAVLLTNLDEHAEKTTAQASTAAEKIFTHLNQPYLLEGQSFTSTPSIGIALFGGHATDTDQLLKRADTAMYQAKKAGRNTLYFFSEDT